MRLTSTVKMLVMGGGRVAPNPSNEVDVYDPGTNSWTTDSLFRVYANARRNFPTDTDGTTRIWLAGGYDSDWRHRLASMEIFCKAVERQRQHRRQRLLQRLLRPQQQLRQRRPPPQHRNCDGHRHSISNGDTTTRNSSYANTAASADTSASPITPVAASLPATPKLREGGCEAQAWDDCKCG